MPARSSPNRVGRPPSPQRRLAILEAAAELFLEAGYDATSMNEIVARIGGSKGTIYAHFKDKQGLFAGVIDYLLEDSMQPVLRLDAEDMALPGALLTLARGTLEAVSSDREVALQRLVFAESRRVPEIARLYYEHGPGTGHKHLEAYLRRQQKLGNLAKGDPKAAARYFFGMLLHQVMLQRYCGVVPELSSAQISRLANQVVDQFLHLYS